jgi:hypothetical protein
MIRKHKKIKDDIVEINRKDLLHVLNSLQWLTLAAYDGKEISRDDINDTYKKLIKSVKEGTK